MKQHWDGVQGSRDRVYRNYQNISHFRGTTDRNNPFRFCLTRCHRAIVQERVPQLYVHSPDCRDSSLTRSRSGDSPRQPLRLTTSLYWSRRTGKLPASVGILVTNPSSELSNGRQRTSLRIPPLIPAAGAQGPVGEPELYASLCLASRTHSRACPPCSVIASDSSPAARGRAGLTWRQGAKSSPLARMHLW